jgi:type IV pilus assembly protein PilB
MALSTAVGQMPEKKSLLQILGEAQKITRDQARDAMQQKQATTDSLESILIKMGVPERDVYEAHAQMLGVSFLDIDSIQADSAAVNLLPRDLQDRYKAVPIRSDGKTLTVAMANPKDLFAIDEMKMRTNLQIRAVLAPPSQVESLKNGNVSGSNGLGAVDELSDDAAQAAIFDDTIAGILEDLAPVQDMTNKGKKGKEEAPKPVDDNEGVDLTPVTASGGGVAADAAAADEAPIIRIVNTILMYAIKDGASDIHIEPQQKGVRVRYRIDGVLHEQMKVPPHILNPLVSRVKIMADMNIAERRIPQDGRIRLKLQDKEFDMRVNSCPTAFGEKVVMRILDKSSVMIGMEKLGLYAETQAQLLDLCLQPNGMMMVCGPTGSGKTTTLYSVINTINSVEKNFMTVEDPVEYQLPGLSQVHVNRKAGLTFSTALRAFLRQDPDVIMVGETRDLETAEIVVQAALTGHLVLSTIHTNDAPSTTTRLADMGVEPFLISASLIGALAQRLSRRVCANCKAEYKPARELVLRFGHDIDRETEMAFWKGAGCNICKQTGFKGRMGIYELMVLNEEISESVVRRAPVSEIREAARSNGMQTLQEDGFRKCLDGFTTVDEVMRVVFTGGH